MMLETYKSGKDLCEYIRIKDETIEKQKETIEKQKETIEKLEKIQNNVFIPANSLMNKSSCTFASKNQYNFILESSIKENNMDILNYYRQSIIDTSSKHCDYYSDNLFKLAIDNGNLEAVKILYNLRRRKDDKHYMKSAINIENMDIVRYILQKIDERENKESYERENKESYEREKENLINKISKMEQLAEQASGVKILLGRKVEQLILENRILKQAKLDSEENKESSEYSYTYSDEESVD